MNLPDRNLITMDSSFMKTCRRLIIDTCHKRKTYAIGGLSALIPIDYDENANAIAFDNVKTDKVHDVYSGYDGTWVAHPELVPLAREVFEEHIEGDNQLHVQLEECDINAEDLLTVPRGEITEAGLRQNIYTALFYLTSWFSGKGTIGINQMMEETSTAEISRAQVWQWIHHSARLSDGRMVTRELYKELKEEETDRIVEEFGPDIKDSVHFRKAAELLDKLVLNREFVEFLTIPATKMLNS